MQRYILVKEGKIIDSIIVDPDNIHDGTPCPPEKMVRIPQPDKITPQPDLITPQDPVQLRDADDNLVFDKDENPVMIAQPDIVTPQPALVEKVDDVLVDPRWIPPVDCELIQSDVGGKGDSWPLPEVVENPNDEIFAQIAALEQTVTERRIREAILGVDNGWLVNVNNQIAALRGQLV